MFYVWFQSISIGMIKTTCSCKRETALTWIWHHKQDKGSDKAGTTVCPLNPFVPTRINHLHVGTWKILTSDQQTQSCNSKRKCLFMQKAHFHRWYSSRHINQLLVKGREDVNISYIPILEGEKLTAGTNKRIMCLNTQLSLRNRWRGCKLKAPPDSWCVLKRQIRTAETVKTQSRVRLQVCPAPGSKLAVHFFKQSVPPLFSAGVHLKCQFVSSRGQKTFGRYFRPKRCSWGFQWGENQVRHLFFPPPMLWQKTHRCLWKHKRRLCSISIPVEHREAAKWKGARVPRLIRTPQIYK